VLRRLGAGSFFAEGLQEVSGAMKTKTLNRRMAAIRDNANSWDLT